MAFNTNNPVGSTDPRDLSDNSENFDKLANGTDPAYADRLGKKRKSFAGMESEFAAFIAASGYEFVGNYAAGITITGYQQVVKDVSGEFWRLDGATALPYTTTGAGLPEGGAFVAVGDAALRQELNGPLSSGQGANLVNGAAIYVGSVAELEGWSLPVSTNVYLTEEGRAGEFVVKTGTSPSDPQKGIYIVLANGNYAERRLDSIAGSGIVNIEWFGAVGDDSTDCTAAIQGAIDFGYSVYVPNKLYRVTGELVSTNQADFIMDGTITVLPDFVGTVLTIGSTSTQMLYHDYKLNVRVAGTPTWNNGAGNTYNGTWNAPSLIGVRLINFTTCTVNLAELRGFDLGASLYSNPKGTAYNKFKIGKIDGCQVGIEISGVDANSWANNNVFNQGSWNIHGFDPGDLPRYGVVLASNGYVFQNNVFNDSCIELGVDGSSTQERVAFLINSARNTIINNTRTEMTANPAAVVINDYSSSVFTEDTTISFGVGSVGTLQDNTLKKATTRTNLYFPMVKADYSANKALHFNSDPFFFARNENGQAYLHGYHVQRVDLEDAVPLRSQSEGAGSTSINLSNGAVGTNLMGVGIRVSGFELNQAFEVNLDDENNRGFTIRAWDSLGLPITSGNIFSSRAGIPSFYNNATFRKGWSTDRQFRVIGANVAYFDVIAAGNGVSNEIYKLEVRSVGNSKVKAYPGYDGPKEYSGSSVMFQDTIASTTIYRENGEVGSAVGDLIFNSAPVAGGKAGWICITAGTPGTWKAFGVIDA